jgi:hypothetical protein
MTKKIRYQARATDVFRLGGKPVYVIGLPPEAGPGLYEVTLKLVEPIEQKPKPCPLCGGDAEIVEKGMNYAVRCRHCGCEGPEGMYKIWARVSWNRRVP